MQAHKQPKSGEIVAVLLSVWLGIVTTTFCHLWSVYNPVRANPLLLKMGSLIPGWWGIGPYAGKEMAGLVIWLATWAILHWTIGRIEVALKPWTIGFIVAFLANLIIVFPPVYHALMWWPALPNTSPGGGG